jgi:hypothetical protein
MKPLPTGYIQRGQQIINTQSGAVYEREDSGQLQRVGTISRAHSMALQAGIDPAEVQTPADISALAALYPLALQPDWSATIFQRTQRTEEVFLVLTALHHLTELATLSDPRERAERREWLWAACNDLAGVPGWAYRYARELSGIELEDGAAEDIR